MNRRSRGQRSRPFSIKRDRQSSQGALNPPVDESWEAFASNLAELEAEIQAVRQRFEAIQTLKQQQQSLQQQLGSADLSPSELQQLKKQLDDLALQLEISLLDWRSLLEPFWQAVRFGGLGIIIGWVLRAISHG